MNWTVRSSCLCNRDWQNHLCLKGNVGFRPGEICVYAKDALDFPLQLKLQICPDNSYNSKPLTENFDYLLWSFTLLSIYVVNGADHLSPTTLIFCSFGKHWQHWMHGRVHSMFLAPSTTEFWCMTLLQWMYEGRCRILGSYCEDAPCSSKSILSNSGTHGKVWYQKPWSLFMQLTLHTRRHAQLTQVPSHTHV